MLGYVLLRAGATDGRNGPTPQTSATDRRHGLAKGSPWAACSLGLLLGNAIWRPHLTPPWAASPETPSGSHFQHRFYMNGASLGRLARNGLRRPRQPVRTSKWAARPERPSGSNFQYKFYIKGASLGHLTGNGRRTPRQPIRTSWLPACLEIPSGGSCA